MELLKENSQNMDVEIKYQIDLVKIEESCDHK